MRPRTNGIAANDQTNIRVEANKPFHCVLRPIDITSYFPNGRYRSIATCSYITTLIYFWVTFGVRVSAESSWPRVTCARCSMNRQETHFCFRSSQSGYRTTNPVTRRYAKHGLDINNDYNITKRLFTVHNETTGIACDNTIVCKYFVVLAVVGKKTGLSKISRENYNND